MLEEENLSICSVLFKHLQPHHTDFGTVQDRTWKKKKNACMCLLCVYWGPDTSYMLSHSTRPFIRYFTQQDFEAALFDRCTDLSGLTKVPRLDITSFWSQFHQSKWLPQSRLLFHVCDLKKPLICINCPKYIHKTSIQWIPELLFWTPQGSQGELKESLSQLWSSHLWNNQASCSW